VPRSRGFGWARPCGAEAARARHSASIRAASWWLALALLLAAAGCHGASETPQRIYEWHCLGCHGAKGEGPWGPNIQGLNRSIDQIVAVIADGRGKMPAFGGHLSQAEMRQLAEYVKTFKYKP
jgi:mono/diheme cytochrome c family protein